MKYLILLIEGNPVETQHNFDMMAIKGALVSIQTIWYVPIIFSRTKEDSRDILIMISRQVGICIDVVSLRGGYQTNRDLASWSGGLGLNTSLSDYDIEVSYSYSSFEIFDSVNRVSLVFSF